MAITLFPTGLKTPFGVQEVAAAFNTALRSPANGRAQHAGRCIRQHMAGRAEGRAQKSVAGSDNQTPRPRQFGLFYPYQPGATNSTLKQAVLSNALTTDELYGMSPFAKGDAAVRDMVNQPYFTGGYCSFLLAQLSDADEKSIFTEGEKQALLSRFYDIAYLAEVIFCAFRGHLVHPHGVKAANLKSQWQVFGSAEHYIDLFMKDSVERVDGADRVGGAGYGLIAASVMPPIWRAAEMTASYLAGWWRTR